MIPADKRPWFCAWFSCHAERRITAQFGTVRIHGLRAFVCAAQREPLVVVANHTAWWDPLVALLVSHRLANLDGYAVMDADNLRQHPYFARVGAIGVERSPAAAAPDTVRLVRHCARLLDRRRRVLWVYPQGDERPAFLRPLGFHGGAACIAKVAGVPVVPLAVRYVFGSCEQPDLYISIGHPLDAQRSASVAFQEAAVLGELDRIENALRGSADEFAIVLPRRRVPARDWAARLLAGMMPLRPPLSRKKLLPGPARNE